MPTTRCTRAVEPVQCCGDYLRDKSGRHRFGGGLSSAEIATEHVRFQLDIDSFRAEFAKTLARVRLWPDSGRTKTCIPMIAERLLRNVVCTRADRPNRPTPGDGPHRVSHNGPSPLRPAPSPPRRTPSPQRHRWRARKCLRAATPSPSSRRSAQARPTCRLRGSGTASSSPSWKDTQGLGGNAPPSARSGTWRLTPRLA